MMIKVFQHSCVYALAIYIAFAPQCLYAEPNQIYVRSNAIATTNIHSKDYVIFPGDPLRLVFPSTMPDLADVNKPLSTFLSLGEKRSVTFSVTGQKTLGKAEVVVTDLVGEKGSISKDNLQVRVAKYRERKGQKWWPRHHRASMIVPLYLQSKHEFTIQQNTTQQFWILVSIPDHTTPGTYKGRVNIVPENGSEDYIELQLEVLPIKLATNHNYFLALYMYLSDKKNGEYYRKTLIDMKDHGLTALAVIGDLGEKLLIKKSKAIIDWSGNGRFELAMNAVTKEPLAMNKVLWLMAGRDLGDIYPWCKKQERRGKITFGDCYTQIITQIEERRIRMGWPEIIYQPIDEPSTREKSGVVAKETYPALKKVDGIKTEINSANNKYSMPINRQLREYIDVFTFHSGPFTQRGKYNKDSWKTLSNSLKRDGKSIWFYNIDNTGWHTEAMRHAFGFGLFAAEGSGMLQWSYQVPVYFKFNGDGQGIIENNSFHAYMYPANNEDAGGPSLGYEMIREGINDLRYLETLREIIRSNDFNVSENEVRTYWKDIMSELGMIDFAGASGMAAQGRWSGFSTDTHGKTHVFGDLKMENGLKYKDYDRIRRLIATYIIKITNESK